MDNPLSLPQLKLPSVPDDFNGGVGVEYARALFRLLEGSQVTGGSLDNAQPFDVSVLQQSVEDLGNSLDASKRKMRKVTMNGVNDGFIVVPFPDIGTTNYDVSVNILIPDLANPGTVLVFPVADSFQTAQFKARVDGAGGAYVIQFVIIEIKDGGV